MNILTKLRSFRKRSTKPSDQEERRGRFMQILSEDHPKDKNHPQKMN